MHFPFLSVSWDSYRDVRTIKYENKISLYTITFSFSKFILLARSPHDPQRIRVASVFEFSVLCLLVGYTTHYTLHTEHYTLHTTHYTLQYTLHTTHYTLYTTHYTLYTTHYKLHTIPSH